MDQSAQFKKLRKTNTGSIIIDVENQELFQTPWMQIVYEPEYSICTNADKLREVLETIDNRIIEYSSTTLGFSDSETRQMYRPLLRNDNFSTSVSSTSILFDSDKNFYNKPDMNKVLKKGQYVRYILKFKKIYFKDQS